MLVRVAGGNDRQSARERRDYPLRPVADQAALHGLLNRIRDMNLKLVIVEKKAEL